MYVLCRCVLIMVVPVLAVHSLDSVKNVLLFVQVINIGKPKWMQLPPLNSLKFVECSSASSSMYSEDIE